ncbi:dihydrofolate reductase [Undibacterium sp. RTI2.1]|uniref:dihydrofolate reductase n=1 Tax=unclassified Undibacterium TaxID=2630295 RepID=UPI002AB4D93D|nr:MULTISPECIES: dihydrofolate reductase [unclassified Undibacterium]MDY7538365.1 dihydrofolate reductase [Undibacterium sp. 5I1]MEB0032522.1 dihydrofolate reductase [Undibacterium sp. RTI2.1]MEB0115011.1 dihydrofolate reductase [Undibacterium sp. RTI2.2]MEB0229360.1 dihydrofolate reductase [Undibacterium sp. 10I3]MEB0255970.1 dihydrofolate reductase [Undibacterium sp. 5I1]
MSSFTIIVATDLQRGIGVNNTLPWHLPEDLAHFKNTTSGHAIVMGRKTFDSIGRALPNRRNIVISRNPAWSHEGVECVSSLEAALALLKDKTQDNAKNEQAFIIGGAEIYQQALPFANKLIITEIQQTFNCDAFFPLIEAQEWTKISSEQHHSEKSQLDYAFVTYQRNN